jgi:hypothetical protein
LKKIIPEDFNFPFPAGRIWPRPKWIWPPKDFAGLFNLPDQHSFVNHFFRGIIDRA